MYAQIQQPSSVLESEKNNQNTANYCYFNVLLMQQALKVFNRWVHYVSILVILYTFWRILVAQRDEIEMKQSEYDTVHAVIL